MLLKQAITATEASKDGGATAAEKLFGLKPVHRIGRGQIGRKICKDTKITQDFPGHSK